MAVAIEILLMTGLRINNLVNLDVERHLVRPARHQPDLHIVIAGEEVKNGEPLEYPLPAESATLIDRYLREFRPRLARGGSTALFPGRGAAPKALNVLRQQIIGCRVQVHRLARQSAPVPAYRRQVLPRCSSRPARSPPPRARPSLDRDDHDLLHRLRDGRSRAALRRDHSEAAAHPEGR